MSLTVTDIFAGFGGASTGAIEVPGIEIKIAANHWPLAVEVHNMNHPDADHACVDLHMEDPRYFPKTDLLWASPECTKWSQAGAGKNARKGSIPGDWNLFSEIDEDLLTTDDDEATRSRLLMFDVLRFIDHHRYAGVIVENVVDIATNAKYAAAWRAWQQGLINLGYDYRVVSLNSMHAQALGMPAPQSRDRLYVVAWPKGNRPPDIDKFMRPRAWCASCEKIVESIQTWKNGRTVGKYRTQYVYLCRHCKSQVEPGWLPASTAIDWMLKGTRIGDRDRPLSEKTRARIAAGIARYWLTTYETRALAAPPFMDARPSSDPLSTITASGNHHALLAPYYGSSKDAKPTEQPIGTLTTRDRYALIQRHNTGGAEMLTPGDVEAAEAIVDDCTFRMLQPHEIGKGMAFPDDYIVKGSKRDQVKGYGNAVTPPAARDLVGALAESLGHEVMA